MLLWGHNGRWGLASSKAETEAPVVKRHCVISDPQKEQLLFAFLTSPGAWVLMGGTLVPKAGAFHLRAVFDVANSLLPVM